MILQREDQTFGLYLLMIVFVIAIVVASLLIVRIITTGNTSGVETTSTTSTSTVNVVGRQPASIAEALMHNQQAVGLPNNWATFSASINYADYAVTQNLGMEIPPVMPMDTNKFTSDF